MRYLQIRPLTEMQLDEIRMSPTSLRQLAAQIDARAGMEFEMIVPGTENDDPDDTEPDYDQDERCRSIENIVDFFSNGDMNDRSTLRQLESALNDAFQEWKFEQLGEEWDRRGYEYLKSYIDDHGYFDRDEAVDTARDEFIDANPDIPPDSEEAQRGISARVEEMEEEFAQETWEDGIRGNSRVYDEAQSDFNDYESGDVDESDWLRNEGLHYMSDVENSYNVSWPFWGSVGNGGRSSSEVADSFEYAIGKPVNHASGYHSARREAGKYVVEPDGSLEGDSPGDAGLEFVSPPMPVQELFDDLKKVKRWADKEGCYTNESTGLHMNISVPSLEGNVEGKLDFVKLAVLMGDKYVLDKFGRSGNSYCKSALEKVQREIKSNPDKAKSLLDQMKGHMNEFASRAVHGTTTHKYTSINTKGGYVEFRGPGYDWLGDNFDLIEDTMLRFVVALDAACDPQKYRQEYLKKLYKLLAPTTEATNPDTIKYFADYVAGNIPKAALRSFIKQAQLERNITRGKQTGKMWWRVGIKDNPNYAIEVVGANRAEAISAAKANDTYLVRYNKDTDFTAKPVRPFEDDAAKPKFVYKVSIGNDAGARSLEVEATSPEEARMTAARLAGHRNVTSPDQIDWWSVRQLRPAEPEQAARPGGQPATGPTLNGRPSNPTGNFIIYNAETPGNMTPVYRFLAADQNDALVVLGQWRRANPGVWDVAQDPNQTAGQPAAQQPTGTQSEGNWGFWITSANRFARMPGQSDNSVLRRFPSREAAEQFRANTPGIRSDLEIREIPVPGSTMDRAMQRAAAAQNANYEIYDTRTGARVEAFHAESNARALSYLEAYQAHGPHNLSPDDAWARYRVRPIDDAPSSSNFGAQERTGDLTPRGPGPWEIYRLVNGEAVRPLEHTNRMAAESEARSALGLRGLDPELYGVRTRQQESGPNQTQTVPGQPQQRFTGSWNVLMGGQQVFRVQGETQAIANAAAREWLRQRSPEFNQEHAGQEVEVVPHYQ